MNKLLLLLLFSTTGVCIAQTPNGQSFYRQADSLYRQGSYALAKPAYTQTMGFYKDKKLPLSLLYCYRARCERHLNQLDQAIKDVDSSIAITNKNPDVFWDKALIYSDQKKHKQAIKEFNNAIALVKNDEEYLSKLYDGRADEEYELGNYQQTIKDDSVALKFNPKNGDAYWHRGLAFKSTGKLERAIIDYTAAIPYQTNKEDWALLYYNRANAYYKLLDYVKSINDYNYAIYLDPTDQDMFYGRGLALARNHSYQLAVDDFTKSLTFDNLDSATIAKLHAFRGENYAHLYQLHKAIDDLNTAINYNPAVGSYYWTLGDLHSKVADFKTSNINYMQAIPLYKNNNTVLAFLYDAMANNNYFLKDYQTVVDNCNLALAIKPDLISSYYSKAKALTKSGHTNDALILYKKILDIDTTKISTNYIFALFYTGNLAKAVQLMNDRVSKIGDNNDKIVEYYNIACLLSIQNKSKEANYYLKLAMDGGYPKSYINSDEDLDNIRGTPAFLALLGQPETKQ